MTSLYMKSKEEQLTARKQWVAELIALPNRCELNYESAAAWLVNRYFSWKLPNYSGRTFKVVSKYGLKTCYIEIECTMPQASYTDTFWDFYQERVEYTTFLSAHDVKVKKDTALLSVLFQFITAHFDAEITPKMFSLLSEHIAADLDGCLANNDEQGFAERIAKYWKDSGAVSGASSGIHECITYGYGCIDNLGFWMIPLPDGEEIQQPKLVEFQPSEEMLAKLEGTHQWFSFYKQKPRLGSVLELRTSAEYSNVRRGGPDFRDGTFYGIFRQEGLFEVLPDHTQGVQLTGCYLDFRYLEGDETAKAGAK